MLSGAAFHPGEPPPQQPDVSQEYSFSSIGENMTVRENLESLPDIAPVPPTPERFAEITNKVYEEEYEEFMSGYRQGAKETVGV